MVLGAATAAAAATGSTGISLFEYNRENFLYDRKMRQETEYQIMDFRIKQAELWREDVKDIIGLTSVKMDTYLIVNAVQLGFCVMAFCEGRIAAGTPTWLIGCHTLCLGGAFMYLLMSVWLSMHASVTAKAYEVRLLTQHVRLPVPTWAQLEGARTYGSTFEKVNTRQMFRMPFAMGPHEKVLQAGQPPITPPTAAAPGSGAGLGAGRAPRAERAASGLDAAALGGQDELPAGSADMWGLEARGDHIYELDGTLRSDPRNLRHLRLVHEALQYWQSYDGFARVAMSMGTNQLVTALAYYVIAYVLVSNHAVVACWLAVLLFMVITSALIRLDMSLTGFEYRTAVVLVTSGPMMAAVAAQQWLVHRPPNDEVVKVISPLVYVTHAVWLLFLLYVCKVSEQKNGCQLPVGFRSVMYIDIFGWIKSLQPPIRRARNVAQPQPHGPMPNGCGPAVQAVKFEGGRPLLSRPEQMPGAASQAPDTIKREDFEPSTFIPRMRDENEASHDDEVNGDGDAVVIHQKPGFVPWRIFFYATMTLIILWWVSGVFVLLQVFDIDWFKVAPLLRVEHTGSLPESSDGKSMLLQATASLSGGVLIPTSWPRPNVRPFSLACSDNGDGAMVALSRFGFFAADFPQRRGGVGAVSGHGINFTSAPACGGIEGEVLRDATIACGADVGGGCSAFVLHRQGQLFSVCQLLGRSGGSSAKDNRQSSLLEQGAWLSSGSQAMSFADHWLGEGDLSKGAPQEEVDSVAFVGRCRDGAEGHCAFAETSGHRVVEMRTTGRSAGDQPDWFPSRIIQAPQQRDEDAEGSEEPRARSLIDFESTTSSESSLRLLGDVSRQQLGMLRTATELEGDREIPQQNLEVISAVSGARLGVWSLPRTRRWTSMCSAGDDLYLLASGASPQVWRFPLPSALQLQLTGSVDKSAVQLAQSTASVKERGGGRDVGGTSHGAAHRAQPRRKASNKQAPLAADVAPHAAGRSQ
mmetsp:Transcript_53019/g.152771  ORF Transcript_53019/g.152771 Transcript_53019/m.152771 type:complete len:978 (+) Transcript_53019:84-3017(+)